MEQIFAVPFRAGDSVCCDNSTIATTHLDITRLNLMVDAASFFSNSLDKVSAQSVAPGDDDDCSCRDLRSEVSDIVVQSEDRVGKSVMLNMISEKEKNLVPADDVINPDSEEDESLSLEGDRIVDSCSVSVASETSSLCGDDYMNFDTASDIGMLSPVEIQKSFCGVDIVSRDSNVEGERVSDPLAMTVSLEEEVRDAFETKSSSVVLQLDLEKGVSGTVVRSVFEVDYVPLWGSTSVCGRRPEMEDAIAAVPYYLKIPIQMLVNEQVLDGMNRRFNHQTAHFFGVYDGHGGLQVLFLNCYIYLCCLVLRCYYAMISYYEEIHLIR